MGRGWQRRGERLFRQQGVALGEQPWGRGFGSAALGTQSWGRSFGGAAIGGEALEARPWESGLGGAAIGGAALGARPLGAQPWGAQPWGRGFGSAALGERPLGSDVGGAALGARLWARPWGSGFGGAVIGGSALGARPWGHGCVCRKMRLMSSGEAWWQVMRSLSVPGVSPMRAWNFLSLLLSPLLLPLLNAHSHRARKLLHFSERFAAPKR